MFSASQTDQYHELKTRPAIGLVANLGAGQVHTLPRGVDGKATCRGSSVR